MTLIDRTNTRVQGVGIDDMGGIMFVGGVAPTVYSRWNHMLMRCYNSGYQARFPTYVGCTVCSEWLHLSKFKEWFDANYKDGLELDKDILVKGNKVYSPDTCCFVPKYINYLQLDSSPCVRELNPANTKGRRSVVYQARVGLQGKSLTKTFPTQDQAYLWYIQTKTMVVKDQAIKAFLANEINSDVYLALVRRRFDDAGR